MSTTSEPLRLMCVLAHPDDETLGTGGSLSLYAKQGVETHVVTATRGEAGRYRTPDTPHPGPEALGRIREDELRAATNVLGVKSLDLLGYPDGGLDGADPREAIERIVTRIRRVRPQVVITFDPYGAYGHPDHIAISQLTTAATVAAADAEVMPDGSDDPPHGVSKLYYMAWPPEQWEAYQTAFKRLVSRVDGVERMARPWPDWAITTRVDAASEWRTVWDAVRCHESQMDVYGPLKALGDEVHRILWGSQCFYRAFSTVNGGRTLETDLFDGIR